MKLETLEDVSREIAELRQRIADSEALRSLTPPAEAQARVMLLALESAEAQAIVAHCTFELMPYGVRR